MAASSFVRSSERVKPIVIGFPKLPNGGRVGVGDGLGVGVLVGVACTSSGVKEGVRLGVALVEFDEHPVVSPAARRRISNVFLNEFEKGGWFNISKLNPFGPRRVGVFLMNELISAF